MDRKLVFETHPQQLSVMLFKDVSNASEIRAALIAKTQKPEAAFLNAQMIPDLFLLHVAAAKALTDQKRGKLVTHALHSELVYNVAGSRNISDSLQRFGVSDAAKALLVARFDATEEDLGLLRALIKGTEADLGDLPGLCDAAAVRKAAKCCDQELAVGSLLDCTLCKVALRDC